jgi:cell division protease FtsH
MATDPKWSSSQNKQFNFFYFFIAFMAVLLIQDAWQNWKQVDQIPYNTFQSYLKDGRVKSIVIGKNQITGELEEARQNEKKRFSTKKS